MITLEELKLTTLYQSYCKANKDNLDSLAIITMDGGYRYTHGELLNMVDLVAGGFSKLGITRNSKVGIMLNNTIEEAVSLLALNKLGAISIFVDVTKSISDIEHSLSRHELSLLIIDEVMLPMEQVVNTNKIPLVIANLTKPSEKGIPFTKLYDTGKDIEVVSVQFEMDKPSVIINSSGTTGIPKPIVHTDFSVNMATYKMFCADYPMSRDNLIMKIIPSYIGLGLITTLYTALLTGTKIVLIGGNNPHQSILNTVIFASNFPMFREGTGLNPNAKLLMFTAPMYYRIMCEKLDIFEDLSYMGAMLAAGSKMSKEELDTMNDKMGKLNCPVKICNGYGQNEMCGAVTLNTNSKNKNGSAGVAVYGTELKIVDPDTYEEKAVGEQGLVIEKSESLFLCYDNMPEETAASFITLSDGTVWLNTKDLGIIDCEGFLHILGRTSRVLVRFDFKLPIDKIENKIKSHPAVLDCAVVGMQKSEIEEVPIAYIIIKDDYKNVETEMIFEEIQKGMEPLSDMEYPERVYTLPNLPCMKNGKVDYRKLEEMAKNQ